MTKVTIGIPFYNNENTLEYAVRSVLNQTFEDWLLILVNDGSTDDSLKIARSFESEKITVLNDGENKGLIYRLNQLVDLCATEYFCRMDSDDIMTTNRLEEQITLLDSRLDVDVVGSSAYVIDEKNKITGVRKSNQNKDYNVDVILKENVFIHPSVVGKTEWFKKHKYKNEFHRAEDLELWCRTVKDSKFINIDCPLLFYRDPEALNFGKYYASLKTVKKIIKKYKKNNKIVSLQKVNMKIILYRILSLLKKEQILYNNRNLFLDEKQNEIASEKLLKSIK